jgi:prepilin-type N-terminal cleavage/methylation domain-containing protein
VKTLAIRERFLEDERGFTLSEMLVTILIMIVVLFALYSIFDMSLKVFSFGNNKVEAVESARVGIEKMEREIRQAHVPSATAQMFDTWTSTQIRFGNDLDGNGSIQCPNTDTPAQCEKIGYQIYENPAGSGNYTLGRDNTSDGTTNTVANLQPVAEHVQNLTFTYYDRSGNEVVPGVGNELNIDRVLVSMEISVDRGVGNPGTQTLATVIDLRNRYTS